MEFLILLAALLGGLYFVVLPILLIINMVRASAHAGKLEHMQRALDGITARCAALERRLSAPEATPPSHKDSVTADRPPVSAHPVPVTAPQTTALPPQTSPISAPLLPTAELPGQAPSATWPIPTTLPAESVPRPPVIVTEHPTTQSLPTTVPPAAEPRPAMVATASTQPPAVIASQTAIRTAPATQHPVPEHNGPHLPEKVFCAIRDWLFGGNTLVRIGMLLVFLGLAFLLRYASDHIVIPLELRYIGVAATALVALGLGWRLRLKRPAYALLMQGGAVAVMYLTVFAALKLHDHPLLPTQAGFALLVATVVLSGLLAVTQNSLALSAAGSLGGFAAPILVSTGSGNHAALFSYFALLNTGILGVAWFKAWRPLNLIGFFGTFLIGLAWGLRSYDPVLHYTSTQPFLILFFLMFVTIGLLFARRVLLDDPAAPTSRDTAEWAAWFKHQDHKAQRYVDGTLLFGTPVVAFGIQYGLVRHIECGGAFSALALGIFYMLLAFSLQKANPLRHRLLIEVFLALGVIFSSLAIPLGLDALWTSSVWALEAAGIYWIGHRQGRPLARAFALILQISASFAFLQRLSPGSETLLEGPQLGALMLGVSFLCNMQVLRTHLPALQADSQWDGGLQPLFSTAGLWALYLIAPMTLAAEHTATALAVAGVVTTFAGLRLGARAWVGNSFVAELLAGIIFICEMDGEGINNSVLAYGGSGWKGLVIASLIGLCSLGSIALALVEARRKKNQALVTSLAWAMLFGLGFIALAVLFILPWQTATAVWAACGFVLMWAAWHLELVPAFWFALVLEVFAGLSFLDSQYEELAGSGHLAAADGTNPFAHAGFWTPIVLALSAFAVAWRLFSWMRKDEDKTAVGSSMILPGGALFWAAGWWAFAWWAELSRPAGDPTSILHDFLAAMTLGAALALPVAARWRWPLLTGLLGMLLPLTCLVALSDYHADANPLGTYGWAVYGCTLLAILALLRTSAKVLSTAADAVLHFMTCGTALLFASIEMRFLFLALGEPGSTWRWLGWTLPLVAWLLWQARTAQPRRWPASTHPQTYKVNVTFPVLLILIGWGVTANVSSGGNAAPLPFIPLINPLDLALVLILFAGWQWLRYLRAQTVATCQLQPLAVPLRVGLFGLAFLTYTCVILRGAHHLADVDWTLTGLMSSMLVQACLSLGWALLALGMMITGHRTASRAVWISGAVLVAVVVAKLFFIELSNRGGLERIISFIGVGILLLVVGYFAPLPPAVKNPPAQVPE